MSGALAPLWLEVMVMQPHHLQQLERSWTARLEDRVAGLVPGAWGLRSIAFDSSLLPLGRVGIVACHAVLPDGTVVNLPDDLGGPLVREIPPGTSERLLKLALPLGGGDRPLTEPAGAPQGLGRFRAEERPVRDATAPDRRVETLNLAVPQLRLLIEGEPESEMATLPIARIRREECATSVTLIDEWLPPSLDCRANPRFGRIFREIEALLRSRGDALAMRLDPNQASADIAGMIDLAMLMAVNRAQPIFNAMAEGGGVAPETAYRECLRLAGELSTFTANRRPAPLPAFRHEEPTGCFTAVLGAITAALGRLADAAATALPLARHEHGVWVSQLRDRPLFFEASQLVLAVTAARDAEELRRGFPAQVKIGPLEAVRDLVSLQLPGLAILPMPVAPREIPYRTGTAYFEIERSGEMWRRLQSSVALALHVGGEWPELSMELWAIRRVR